MPDSFDTDNDGTADCVDGCFADPQKIAPGECDCGYLDSHADMDGDTFEDCVDACPEDPLKQYQGLCGCDVPDDDTDMDDYVDCEDNCPTVYNPDQSPIC